MNLASVIQVFEEQIPPKLAEKWDNTGLLIEPCNNSKVSVVFFTNDLTEKVVEEAISVKSNLIVSYHPPIFSPLKSLRQCNWKDRIVMKCIENSIAVYSPHTSCDAVKDGVNDWLISCFNVSDVSPIIQSYETQSEFTKVVELSNIKDDFKGFSGFRLIDERAGLKAGTKILKFAANEKSVKDILKVVNNENLEFTINVTPMSLLPLISCGMGRIGKLAEPLPLEKCINLVKLSLNLEHIRFAQSVSHSLDSPISVIAVCAGSGSSVLKGVKADLYITGEMSHHDLLDTVHQNVSVILCEHSNSERGYLRQLVKLLSPKLNGVQLLVSASDKDPISIF